VKDMDQGTYLSWLTEKTRTGFWHDSADPAELQLALGRGATGATTNPCLVSLALENRARWASGIISVAAMKLAPAQRAEELMRQVLVKAAAMCRSIHHASGGQAGLVCAQLNPMLAGERGPMLAMARRFHSWAPNIAVKLPAVSAGLDVLEDCIAEGISAMATISFAVSQVIAAAERCREGRRRAKEKGIEPGRCFAVIMVGRLDDYLIGIASDHQAGIKESVIRQAGLAVAKRACEIYLERGYETTLLIAALRGSYHLTELAGAPLIVSMAPAAQEWFIVRDYPREEKFANRISSDVLRQLSRMPEFLKAYERDGMGEQEFISYGATQRTLSQYIETGWKLLEKNEPVP
jgi:transaldolase